MINFFNSTKGMKTEPIDFREVIDAFGMTKLNIGNTEISIYKNSILPDKSVMVSPALYDVIVEYLKKNCIEETKDD